MNEQVKSKGCPKCGRIIAENVDDCPYCGYKFAELNAYYSKMEKTKFDTVGNKYAGALKRIIAFLTDFVFITLICLIFITFSIVMQYNFDNYFYLLFILFIFWTYKVLLEGIISTTIGKRIVGIEILDDSENKLNLIKSLARNLAIILDILTIGIGFIIILFTSKKVCLHDIVSKTIVVNSKEEIEFDDYAPCIIRLMAFVIDLAILFGVAYGINCGVDYIKENFVMTAEISYNPEIIEVALISLIIFFYFVFFESGSGKSTIGKKVFGLRVETTSGEKMGSIIATIRTLCLFIEIITLGFMLCLITNKKQTLKDRIVDTKVVRI